jgi:hypothetical protein
MSNEFESHQYVYKSHKGTDNAIPLCKHHDMKAYMGMEVEFLAFLTSAPDRHSLGSLHRRLCRSHGRIRYR